MKHRHQKGSTKSAPNPQDALRLAARVMRSIIYQNPGKFDKMIGSANTCNLYELCQYGLGEGEGDVPTREVMDYVETQLRLNQI